MGAIDSRVKQQGHLKARRGDIDEQSPQIFFVLLYIYIKGIDRLLLSLSVGAAWLHFAALDLLDLDASFSDDGSVLGLVRPDGAR